MSDITANAYVQRDIAKMDLEGLEALVNRARRLNMPGDAMVLVTPKTGLMSVPKIRITQRLSEDAEYRTRPPEGPPKDPFDQGGLPEAKRVIQDGPPYVVYRDRPQDPEGWWDSHVQYWLGAYGETLTLTEDDRISYAEGLERRLLRDYWPPMPGKPGPEFKPDLVDDLVSAVKVTETAPEYVAKDPDATGIPVADNSPAGWWEARVQVWATPDNQTVSLTGSARMSSQEGKARGWRREWEPMDAPEIPRGATLEPKGKRAKAKAQDDRDQMATVTVKDGQTMAVLPDAVVAMLGHWWWADEFQFWEAPDGGRHTLRASRRMSAQEGHAKGWKRYMDTNRDNR